MSNRETAEALARLAAEAADRPCPHAFSDGPACRMCQTQAIAAILAPALAERDALIMDLSHEWAQWFEKWKHTLDREAETLERLSKAEMDLKIHRNETLEGLAEYVDRATQAEAALAERDVCWKAQVESALKVGRAAGQLIAELQAKLAESRAEVADYEQEEVALTARLSAAEAEAERLKVERDKAWEAGRLYRQAERREARAALRAKLAAAEEEIAETHKAWSAQQARAVKAEEENRKLREALRALMDDGADLVDTVTAALAPASPAPAESEPAKAAIRKRDSIVRQYEGDGPPPAESEPAKLPLGHEFEPYHDFQMVVGVMEAPASKTDLRCKKILYFTPHGRAAVCHQLESAHAAHEPPESATAPIAGPNLATAAEGWTAPTKEGK